MELLNSFEIKPETPLTDFTFPFVVSTSYLIVIFSLRHFMKNKDAMVLKTISIIHNAIMTCLSLFLLLGMIFSIFNVYFISNSFEEFQFLLFCDSDKLINGKGSLFFFCYLFYLSKAYELFDTVLIVLKKGKLMFLHVYHHYITLILMWSGVTNSVVGMWIGVTTNCFVHVPMYYYYYLTTVNPGAKIWWKK
eukprot:gene9271-1358_t